MIRELSLGLLINSDVPFSFFTDPFFEQLAWQLDPHLFGQIPWSRPSMSRLLDDMYKSKKDRVKQELLDALTKIHLGFDLWTLPNRHAIMAFNPGSRNTLNETATQRQKQVMMASRQAKTNTSTGLRTAKVTMAPSTILSLTGTRSDSSIQTYREWRLIFSRYNQCLLSVSVFSQQQVGW